MKRARVLVVDDKETYLSLFRRILPPDLEVVCAADGRQALELLAADGFDVVVSDVRMPGADGLQVLEAVRDSGARTEVVLVTAYGSIPDAVRAMKGGASDFLTKPFDPDEAVAAVERALVRVKERRVPTSLPYREAIAVERDRATAEYLIELLRELHGNVTAAAERAGIERESFHRLMKRHGVNAEDFRGK